MKRLFPLLIVIALSSSAAFSASSWRVISTYPDNTIDLSTVSFANESVGYAGGKDKHIWKTTDRGKTWQIVLSEAASGNDIIDLWCVNANTVYAIQKDAASSQYKIIKTTNGGTSWTDDTALLGANISLTAIQMLDENTGYAVGNKIQFIAPDVSVVYKRSGGVWANDGLAVSRFYPQDVYFTDENNGVVAGLKMGVPAPANIQRKVAGVWQAAASVPDIAAFNGVHFSGANNGWAVGTSGKMIKSTDAGDNWAEQTSPTANQLNSVHFIDANNGWAIGNSGTIISTTNGGTNWQTETSGTTGNLAEVEFIDQNNGWVVGTGASPFIAKYVVDPAITSISPAARYQGWSGLITIEGTNFQSDITAAIAKAGGSGFNYSLTWNSAAKLTITATLAAAATTGDWTITLTNGDTGTAATAFTVSPPPALTGVTRSHPKLGDVSWDRQGALRQITARGTNFQNGATLTFSGTGVTCSATTFVSASELKAMIFAAETATVSMRDISVVNPDTGTHTLANAFDIRQNTVGPTISNMSITGSSGTNPTTLTQLNPPAAFEVLDVTGLSASTASIKTIAGPGGEYYWEYPASVFTRDPADQTKGSARIVLQKLKRFSDGQTLDAYNVLSSAMDLYFYAEDEDGNPAQQLYGAAVFQGQQAGNAKIKNVLFFPNPVLAHNQQAVVMQFESRDFQGAAEINIINGGGMVMSKTPVTVAKGTNKLNLAIKELPNGVHLATIVSANSETLGKGKLMLAR